MPHMVIFRNSEGKPGYHQAEALDEAVRFVEHLRNQEQVSDARIFSMQEVPIEFKTYYKVELGAPVGTAPVEEPSAAPATESDVAGSEPVEPAAEAAEPASIGNGSAAAHARFGLFNRP